MWRRCNAKEQFADLLWSEIDNMLIMNWMRNLVLHLSVRFITLLIYLHDCPPVHRCWQSREVNWCQLWLLMLVNWNIILDVIIDIVPNFITMVSKLVMKVKVGIWCDLPPPRSMQGRNFLLSSSRYQVWRSRSFSRFPLWIQHVWQKFSTTG